MVSPIYLIIVELWGDADRKRLEYILEKYEESGVRVRKLCAGVLVVDAGAGEALRFLDELLSRFGEGRVKVWSLREPDFEVQPLSMERTFRVTEGFRDVWGIVGFVMSKFRGVLVSESNGGASRVYKVRSKYGVVDVRFDILYTPSGKVLKVRVEGYGTAVPHVFERLVDEISYVEAG